MLHDHEELQKSLDDMQMYYFELQKKALQQPKRFASRKIGMNHKHANLLDNVII